jgi:hypothetical protein
MFYNIGFKHGDFGDIKNTQTPNNNLQGKACNECEKRSSLKLPTRPKHLIYSIESSLVLLFTKRNSLVLQQLYKK